MDFESIYYNQPIIKKTARSGLKCRIKFSSWKEAFYFEIRLGLIRNHHSPQSSPFVVNAHIKSNRKNSTVQKVIRNKCRPNKI